MGRSKAAHTRPPLPPLESRLYDWTGDLRDSRKYSEGLLDQLTLPGEMSALAYEPGMGYLAVGTTCGTVHVFGSPSVRFIITLRPPVRVKHLLFKSDTYLLICVDEKDNLSIYDLSRKDPHASAVHSLPRSGSTPDVPLRVGIHSARNTVLCAEVTSGHSHLFLGLADGTVEVYDLERFCSAPYRIPNLWWNEEEILRRSNVPNAPSRLHIPLIIDIQTHPRDLNILLLCYEGGAILFSLRDSSALRTYQLRLLPGAPGPCADDPLEVIWSERLCSATSVAWHPEGEMFAMGHENGAISFWRIKDEDKPVMVRTLDNVDIERPVPPDEIPKHSLGPREPIFKLAWSGFPAQGWYEYGAQAASAWRGSTATSDPKADAASRVQTAASGTVLTVMGGTAAAQSSACLTVYQLPPLPTSSVFSGAGGEPAARQRQELHDALLPEQVTVYKLSSTVEDFCLLPKINPHYHGTFDPYGVVILVGPDPSLPAIAAQSTHRGLEAYSFPPQRGIGTYQRLHLPLPLMLAGRGTVLGCRVATVPLQQYRRLTQHAEHDAVGSIKQDEPMGGLARPNVKGGALQHALAIARQGRPRFLVTWHLDGTVRFHDISPHLLLLGDEDPRRGPILTMPFPAPLPHLTVRVRQCIMHPTMIGAPALEPIQRFPMQLQIANVYVAWEALECAIELSTGHVVHMALGGGSFATGAANTSLSQAMENVHIDQGTPDCSVPEFTPMDAISDMSSLGFQRKFVYSQQPILSCVSYLVEPL